MCAMVLGKLIAYSASDYQCKRVVVSVLAKKVYLYVATISVNVED